MLVEWGSVVRLEYDLMLDSGDEIDSSAASGPLRVQLGEWDALPGLPEKLVGLRQGDERLICLSPAEAFGEWDPNVVVHLRDRELVGDAPLQDGMTVQIRTPAGPGPACRVFRATEDRVLLDFNHPLAGEPITLFVRVLEVVPGRRRAGASARREGTNRKGGRGGRQGRAADPKTGPSRRRPRR